MPSERKKNTSKPKARTRKLMPLRYDSARIDPWVFALVDKIADDPKYAAMRVSQATVLRMALDEGIEVLAKRYGVKLE